MSLADTPVCGSLYIGVLFVRVRLKGTFISLISADSVASTLDKSDIELLSLFEEDLKDKLVRQSRYGNVINNIKLA